MQPVCSRVSFLSFLVLVLVLILILDDEWGPGLAQILAVVVVVVVVIHRVKKQLGWQV